MKIYYFASINGHFDFLPGGWLLEKEEIRDPKPWKKSKLKYRFFCEAGIKKSAKMSLKVTSTSGWPGQYYGNTGWSEKTRQAQFGGVSPLFDRIVSFNEIQNLKFSIKLSFPKDYEMAIRGPDFEIKLIEGGEMLTDYNFVKIHISYSTQGTTCCKTV